MGRRPNPQRKQDLLDEIVAYLGDHGIGDLSLRPLAKQLGTSTYTLTYQFGSKDRLLADAVRHALARQVGAVSALVSEAGDPAPSDLVRRMWEWSTSPENLGLVRMLLEATTLAYSQPEVFGGVGPQVVSEGVGLLRHEMERVGLAGPTAQRLATQAYATLDRAAGRPDRHRRPPAGRPGPRRAVPIPRRGRRPGAGVGRRPRLTPSLARHR